jgi:hypothetical protein
MGKKKKGKKEKKAGRKYVLLRMKQLEHVGNDVQGMKVMRWMQKENDRGELVLS